LICLSKYSDDFSFSSDAFPGNAHSGKKKVELNWIFPLSNIKHNMLKFLLQRTDFLNLSKKTKPHAWEWIRLVQSILNIEATIALIGE
jgi:hypothetical protein